MVDKLGVEMHYRHDLIAVDGKNKLATFKVTDEKGNVSEIIKHFDMLHVTPPQSAPDFISGSPLANEKVGLMLTNTHYNIHATKTFSALATQQIHQTGKPVQLFENKRRCW